MLGVERFLTSLGLKMGRSVSVLERGGVGCEGKKELTIDLSFNFFPSSKKITPFSIGVKQPLLILKVYRDTKRKCLGEKKPDPLLTL